VDARAGSGTRGLRRSGGDVSETAAVREYFRRTASHWGTVYEGDGLSAAMYRCRHAAALKLVDRLGAPLHEVRALDVGCGPGRSTVALAERGYAVQAVDAVAPMIEMTRARAADAGVTARVHASVADVHTLPFPDAAFGLVVAIGVLPWVRVDVALHELIRVTAPGGWLLLTAANRWSLTHVLDPLLNPDVEPLRRAAGNGLRRLGLWPPPSVRATTWSTAAFRRRLRANGVQPCAGRTVGFGPFSLFGRTALGDALGIGVHQTLQRLADHGVPLLRGGGATYVVLAHKPTRTAPRLRHRHGGRRAA
jgi:ubiquinone/menaquinone biosynthesis C-methylase UbiE